MLALDHIPVPPTKAAGKKHIKITYSTKCHFFKFRVHGKLFKLENRPTCFNETILELSIHFDYVRSAPLPIYLEKYG